MRYRQYPSVLEEYNNANWIADSEESKSTSWYIYTLEGASVSWKSFKQTCIAQSTMKSKFIALDKAGEDANGFDNFWKIYYYGQNQCPPYAFTVISSSNI